MRQLDNLKEFRKTAALAKTVKGSVKGLSAAFAELAAMSALYKAFDRLGGYLGDAVTKTTQMRAALRELHLAAAALSVPLGRLLSGALAAVTRAAAGFLTILTRLLGGSVLTASGLDKMAKTAGSAAKKTVSASKKAVGALAAWDEINVLHRAGGGGGVSVPVGEIEVPAVEPSPFLQAVLDAIELGDWYAVGRLIGEKLRDSLDAIPWPAIQTKARRWAQNLAETLNGVIETPGLWETVGHTLAQGLNTATGTIDTFFQNFHWVSLGEGIGNGLQQAQREIDWPTFGRSLTDGLKGALETLHGFVRSGFSWTDLGKNAASACMAGIHNVDWAQAAGDGSTVFAGLLDAMTGWIDGMEWDVIGQKIADCIESIEYADIANSLAKLIVTAALAVPEFLGGLLADPLTSIKETFLAEWNRAMGDEKDYHWAGEQVITGFNNGIASVNSNATDWIVQNILTPFADGIAEAFDMHSPSVVAKGWGENISQGLYNGVSEKWAPIEGFLANSVAGITAAVASAWGSLQSTTAAVWDGIGAAVKNAVNSVIGFINRLISGIVSGVNALIAALNTISFDLPELLGGGHIGFSLSPIAAAPIPLLAKGGVIRQPTLAMMGEYPGAGANPEIAAPQSVLEETFAASLAPLLGAIGELTEELRNQNNDTTIHFAASGGLEQLVRLLEPYREKERARRGARLVTGGGFGC